MASGNFIPVRHHPDHRGLYRCHDPVRSRVPWNWCGPGGGQGEVKDGFWSLLSFAMQMALVLVLGSAMASAKACKKALAAIATLAHDKKSAILVTTFVSTICCWLNWGFGLIAGALLAKAVARRVRMWIIPADCLRLFRLCDRYAGPSGSIPLQIGGTGSEVLGVVYQAPVTATIFHPMNLVMVLVILVLMPFVNYAMHPDTDHTIAVDPALLVDEAEKTYTMNTPAEKIEHNKVLWFITLVLGFAYIVYYFVQKGFNLDLNIVNMIFLFLGILLHGDLRRYVDAIADAASGAAGILLQFPFYAGIMGLMVAQNDAGVSLAGIIANFFTQISDNVTFPVLTFLSAGIINFFVPSGGGQWAVQAPIVMPAATEMGIEYGRAAMAIAGATSGPNMIQPFWALPALGIAGLSARNIMGDPGHHYDLFTGLVACGGFLLWVLLF